MRIRRPSPALLVALLALFVALGGPAAAQRMAGLKKNSVTGREVKNRSLSESDLRPATVRRLQRTPAGSISSAKLRSRAVTGSKVAPSAIGSSAIADKTITGADIADGSLAGAAIAGGSIGFSELAENGVGKRNMRVGAVGKSEIGDEAVGTEELIDGVAKAADVGAFTGVLTPSFGSIPPGGCAVSADLPVTPVKEATAERPATDLTKTIVLAGQPATWPGDTVTLSARPVSATALRLTACNLGDAAVTPDVSFGVPFVAFAL